MSCNHQWVVTFLLWVMLVTLFFFSHQGLLLGKLPLNSFSSEDFNFSSTPLVWLKNSLSSSVGLVSTNTWKNRAIRQTSLRPFNTKLYSNAYSYLHVQINKVKNIWKCRTVTVKPITLSLFWQNIYLGSLTFVYKHTTLKNFSLGKIWALRVNSYPCLPHS